MKKMYLPCTVVQMLEKKGIGRPSTFSSLISKIQDRGYVKKQSVEGKKIKCVNFMTYVGEPSRSDRERMGWYVILFFVVFTALAYLLFREYQKDYH